MLLIELFLNLYSHVEDRTVTTKRERERELSCRYIKGEREGTWYRGPLHVDYLDKFGTESTNVRTVPLTDPAGPSLSERELTPLACNEGREHHLREKE